MNVETPNPKTAKHMATSVIFMLSVMAGTPSWATDGDAVQTSKDSTTAQKADEFFELAVRYDQASDYPMAVREYQKAAELGHYERCIIWRLPIFKVMASSKIIKKHMRGIKKRRTWVMPVPNIIWAACIFMGKGLLQIKATHSHSSNRPPNKATQKPPIILACIITNQILNKIKQQQNSGFWSRVSWAYLMGASSMIILIN
ncbi:hypothetical protein [Moraxella catarrhalis]|uniref:hypothetical protein n=1 Tax=Moraxella catarrhalis TaxID=480 RepID=UPI0001D264F1|nr:hypothetical protein MCR_1830 [Moraxella catarrhalis BBH18]